MRPDLSVFAKALGAGFPVSALVGRRDIMELFASGRVNHSEHPQCKRPQCRGSTGSPARAVGWRWRSLWTDERTRPGAHDGIAQAAGRLGLDLQISGLPAAFHTCFASHPIHDYATYMQADRRRLDAFMSALLEGGIRPTSRGTWFLSTAHTESDIEGTLEAVDRALQLLNS